MTEKDCCALPMYDNPKVCDRCYDLDGITFVKGKKGTGMGVFAAWLTYKAKQHFGIGRVFPRYLDGSALQHLIWQIENDNWIRASGGCLCPICNHEYRQHPAWREVPTFVLLCDGSVVKL